MQTSFINKFSGTVISIYYHNHSYIFRVEPEQKKWKKEVGWYQHKQMKIFEKYLFCLSRFHLSRSNIEKMYHKAVIIPSLWRTGSVAWVSSYKFTNATWRHRKIVIKLNIVHKYNRKGSQKSIVHPKEYKTCWCSSMTWNHGHIISNIHHKFVSNIRFRFLQENTNKLTLSI